jgi:sucrose-phosphate synthase
MRIMHLALGGCLKAPPVDYGLTEDTGGHIAYVLGAAEAQAARSDVTQVSIVTRAFDEPTLGAVYDRPQERLSERLEILRLRSASRGYLAKEALANALPELERAFLALLQGMAQRPDVLHAHFADAARLARAAERRFGIPWVYTPHSLALEKPDGHRDARRVAAETAAIRGARAVVVSSRDEAERQLARYDAGAAGRVHRVSPGVRLAPAEGMWRGARLIAPFLRSPAKPMVLAVARPVRKKNLAALVRAFAASPALRARANLVILPGLRHGLTEGPDEQVAVLRELFDLVDRHDLWGHVALPRRHSAADLRALYEIAAQDGVFANPAFHEPFGLTLIEAAQAGVPIVATRSGGPSSIVEALGAGRLIDPADPAALAEALLDSLTDPAREPRRRLAQQRAQALFRWDLWAEEVMGIYRSLDRAAPRSDRRPTHLLACDIDGTLTGDRAAARRFAAWGRARPEVAMMVATGRSISEARRVLAAWGLDCPPVMLTSVGSEIWRATGQGGYALCEDFAALIAADWDAEGIDAALAELGLDSQGAQDQRLWKRSFYGDAMAVRRIQQRLARSGLPARVVFSHGRLIDVLPARAGKAAALRFEAERLGLSLAECIAAGDSGNDLDMLRICGCPILPANARDGIAEALRGRGHHSALPHAAGVLDGLDRLFGAPARKALRHA